MQQGTPVISSELSSFLANTISTVVFYGDMLLVGGIVFAAIRVLFAGDDVDLKSHMQGLILNLLPLHFFLLRRILLAIGCFNSREKPADAIMKSLILLISFLFFSFSQIRVCANCATHTSSRPQVR